MSTFEYDRILSSMPPGLDRAILRVLTDHQGRSRAVHMEDDLSTDPATGHRVVTAPGLASRVRSLGFPADSRQIRETIRLLRRQGQPICSAPGSDGGYWLAADWTDLQIFIQTELHAKAIDLLETESALKDAARTRWGNAFQLPLI